MQQFRNLDGMAYAVGAGLNTAKKCLDGTRAEILREIMGWIADPDANAPHILWLHGQAGRGKSAVAHTIVSWNVGELWSCFCFARDRQAERREQKILTTVARDLAYHCPAFRRALVDVISSDPSLKTTPDVMQQWQRLVLEPLSRIEGTMVGNAVIVIDALDETGSDKSRKHILSLLTSTEATRFPPNLRILLTSRLLPDIERALSAVQSVRATSLDDIPMAFAKRDIVLYVARELADLREIGATEVQNIAGKANGLFEWARLACQFILPNRPGQIVMEQYNEIVTGDSGGGLLDAVYRTILEGLIPQDRFTLARFHSVMRQIMTTSVPQRLDTLNEMRSHFPSDEDHFDMIIILEFMAPLLSGITDRNSAVRPLHPSFYDFLRDPSRSGVYCVDGSNTVMHSSLASASLHTLSSDRESNTRGLEDSSEDEVETRQEDADRRTDSVHLAIDEPLVDVWVPGPDFLEFGTSHLSGPEAQKTGLMSRLATLLRRRKSPQCTQERMWTFPVAAAREKMRVIVIPWKENKREGQTDQSGEGNTLYQIDTVTSTGNTGDGQISDDGYHESHRVCCFRS